MSFVAPEVVVLKVSVDGVCMCACACMHTQCVGLLSGWEEVVLRPSGAIGCAAASVRSVEFEDRS